MKHLPIIIVFYFFASCKMGSTEAISPCTNKLPKDFCFKYNPELGYILCDSANNKYLFYWVGEFSGDPHFTLINPYDSANNDLYFKAPGKKGLKISKDTCELKQFYMSLNEDVRVAYSFDEFEIVK